MCVLSVALRCFPEVSLIVEGRGSRVHSPSGAWAVLGGSLLPLWLMKDCAGLPSLMPQLILCSHPHSCAGISPEDRRTTHTHLPTHPCSFWIPSRHGILCSSWQNSWLSCLCSPSSVSWTSSSDSCQPSFLHLDLLRSGSLRASTLLTSEWLCSQSWLHEPSNAHILFPEKPFFNGALWATYFLGFLF